MPGKETNDSTPDAGKKKVGCNLTEKVLLHIRFRGSTSSIFGSVSYAAKEISSVADKKSFHD